MKLKLLLYFVGLAVVFTAALFNYSPALAAHDNVRGWLWFGSTDNRVGDKPQNCSNNSPPNCEPSLFNTSGVGWVSLSSHNGNLGGASYGIKIPQADGPIAGFGSFKPSAWSSNVGWIDFQPDGCCPASPQKKAERKGNNLEGWARILSFAQAGANSGGWQGWIKLSGQTRPPNSVPYGVSINPDTGKISGYAWSNELGWIKFDAQTNVPPPGLGTIKGFKVKMPDNKPEVNPNNPPNNETITLDVGSPTTANPYSFQNVSAGNHTVSVTVPSGWTVGYTLCYNSTLCHNNAPTQGSLVTVNVPDSGFADLWWHYTPPGGILLPSCSISVIPPASGNAPLPVSLRWSSNNATGCDASGGWSGSKSVSGGPEIRPPINVTTAYNLTCKNSSGDSGFCSATATIIPPPNAPTCMLTATPPSVAISPPETTLLEWSSANASSCVAFNGSSGWPGSRNIIGNQRFGPFGTVGDITYNLTCSRGSLSGSCSAKVTVTSSGGGGPTCSGSPKPVIIAAGGVVTWTAQGGTGPYTWILPNNEGGTRLAGTSNTALVKYSTEGAKTAKVSSGGVTSPTCSIQAKKTSRTEIIPD